MEQPDPIRGAEGGGDNQPGGGERNDSPVGDLTAEELVALTADIQKRTDILAFLATEECADMSGDQKDAFLHLAQLIGLRRARVRFHPTLGVDPLDVVRVDTLDDNLRMFRRLEVEDAARARDE